MAFKGRGFEGSWAHATVVLNEGRNHCMVRYSSFATTTAPPLTERMEIERLRLPAPPAPEGWVPELGEPVEGLWNDCWWEDA